MHAADEQSWKQNVRIGSQWGGAQLHLSIPKRLLANLLNPHLSSLMLEQISYQRLGKQWKMYMVWFLWTLAVLTFGAGWSFCVGVSPAHCRMLRSIPDPDPLDASSAHPSSVTTKTVFRHFQMSFAAWSRGWGRGEGKGAKLPQLRTTIL